MYGLILTALIILFNGPAEAKDNGQWDATPQDIREWYEHLMQPDWPSIPCCGESDAYYADKIITRGTRNFAVITDTREDGPLFRPHIPVGTEIEIPSHKYKFDKGNPTGHNIIFLFDANNVEDGRTVLCFVQTGGV